MGLSPTVTEWRIIDQFPEGAELTSAPGRIYIETSWWVHPTNPEVRLLIDQTRITLDDTAFSGGTFSESNAIAKEVEHFDYSLNNLGPQIQPDWSRRERWARLHLPGIATQNVLTLAEVNHTFYWTRALFAGTGPYCKRVVTAGYVIYDQTSKEYQPEDANAELEARGIKGITAPTKKAPDSARGYGDAIKNRAIAPEADVNQQVEWLDPWKVEEEIIEEDYQKYLKWTWSKDYTVPGPPEVHGPEVIMKDPLRSEYPLPVTPPTIKAWDNAQGVYIEIENGGGEYTQTWPYEVKVKVPPDKYALYRRLVSEGDGPGGDPLCVYEPGMEPEEGVRHLFITTDDSRDMDGNPKPILPPSTPVVLPETPTDPQPENFAMIAEVTNAKRGKVDIENEIYLDREVANGATYEYYATAIIGNIESEPSNKAEVEHNGETTLSGIGINMGEEIIIDVVDPPDPNDDFVTESAAYGETEEFIVPALLDTAEGCTSCRYVEVPYQGATGLITDACQLGLAIALRQFMRFRKDAWECEIKPTIPLFIIERGMLATVPEVKPKIYGNDYALVLKTSTEETWAVEGYKLAVNRTLDGDLTLDLGTISLETRTMA